MWTKAAEVKFAVVLAVTVSLQACCADAKWSTIAKCQDDQECQMRPQHLHLYSSIKRALSDDFKQMRGKDLIPFVRSVEILRRRFEQQVEGPQLNGTTLVLALLRDEKLLDTMRVLESDDGRTLINLYKSSINSHGQNMACSQWRVHEIEAAARKLKQVARLESVFANIHRHFVERSARKCLKASCKAINDNMKQLDSVLRRPNQSHGANGASRRRATTGTSGRRSSTDKALQIGNDNQIDQQAPSDNDEDEKSTTNANSQLVDNNEFQLEELELCRFFMRTNSSTCQTSGKHLSAINLLVRDDESLPASNQTKLADFLSSYEQVLKSTRVNGAQTTAAPAQSASQAVLAYCRALRPMLEYHLHALRWYSSHDLIRADKLERRAIWCPSLSYWLETDRLCGELEIRLAKSGDNGNTFAY